jgi:hypothetical protein
MCRHSLNDRALREIDTRFPGVVGRLDKVTCIACGVRLASDRVSVSEPVRIDQRFPGHMSPEKRILRATCRLGSGECLHARLGTAQDQGVNIMRTLVGIDRLKVHQVANHVILV